MAPTIQIPLSQISTPSEFDAAVAKYRAELERHVMGNTGVASPVADMLVQLVIARVPQKGPIESRGPDEFTVLPYEFLDDLPQSAPEPILTLAERKSRLTYDLQRSAQAAKAGVLSPARAQLLQMDASDAMAIPEDKRTVAHRAAIDAYSTYLSATSTIERQMLRAAIAVEDLTDANIDSWQAPEF